MQSKNIKSLLNENSVPIMIGLLIVTVIIGYFLRLSPSLAKLDEVKTSIKSVEDAEKAKLQQILGSAKKNNEYFESLDSSLMNRFYTALPQKKDVPQIYTEIDSLIRQSGVSLEGLDIVEIKAGKAGKGKGSEIEAADPDKPKEIAIGLKVAGSSWPIIKNFLSNMESSLHLMDVLAMTYNPKEGALSLNLRSYFLSPSGDSGEQTMEEGEKE